MRRSCLLLLVLLVGCNGPLSPCVPQTAHPDCVKDDFNYNFYSSSDQGRMTYCYGQLQTLARQYVQEHSGGDFR
jgi:hypothetical protein